MLHLWITSLLKRCYLNYFLLRSFLQPLFHSKLPHGVVFCHILNIESFRYTAKGCTLLISCCCHVFFQKQKLNFSQKEILRSRKVAGMFMMKPDPKCRCLRLLDSPVKSLLKEEEALGNTGWVGWQAWKSLNLEYNFRMEASLAMKKSRHWGNAGDASSVKGGAIVPLIVLQILKARALATSAKTII